MEYTFPMEFCPAPIPLSSGQKKRIARLVEKGLADEKHHYTLPRRILIPLAAILSLFLLIGCTMAQPEIRETVVQTAVKAGENISRLLEKIFTKEEIVIDPYAVIVEETSQSGTVSIELEKAVRDNGKIYLKLNIVNYTGPFEGQFLQFDLMELYRDLDPEGKLKNRESWELLQTTNWGVTGVIAGEVFFDLRADNSASQTIWFETRTGDLAPGEYKLVFRNLYTLGEGDFPDTYGIGIIEEYGETYEIRFTVEEQMESLPVTVIPLQQTFALEDSEMLLDRIEISPLYARVYIQSTKDPVCSLPQYPAVTFAPYQYLHSLVRIREDLKAAYPDFQYEELYDLGYELVPTFTEGIREDPFRSTASFPNSFFEDVPQDVIYAIAATEPLEPEDLLKLELVRYDGQKSVVLWDAEWDSPAEAAAETATETTEEAIR